MNQQNALLVALNALQAIDDKHPYPIAKHAIVQISKALAQTEPQVCCGDYEKCMNACTPRGRWLAEKELAKPEQEQAERDEAILHLNIQGLKDSDDEGWREVARLRALLAQPEQTQSMDEWRSMVVVNLLRRCPNLSKHELRELAAHFQSRLPIAQPEQPHPDHYAEVYIRVGDLHIKKVLTQNELSHAYDPIKLLSLVADDCIQNIKELS